MFTKRVGQGGYTALPGMKQSPHILAGGNARDISATASWVRGSIQSCCATPLIPENDVIMLKVSATPHPQPTSIITRTHISADLLVVVECVQQRSCLDRWSWLTGCEDDVNCSRISVSEPPTVCK